MKIHFYIKYQSEFGEQLFLRFWNKKDIEQMDLPMQYLNQNFWQLEMDDDDLPFLPTLKYDCFLEDIQGNRKDLFLRRVVDLRKHKGDKLDIIDEIPSTERSDILYSKPFRTLLERGSTTVKKPADKNFNLVLRAGLPPLPYGKAVCVTGSGDKLQNWSTTRPLLMYKKDGYWTAKLNLGKEKSIEYKYAIYDLEKNVIETFEEGENRMLHTYGKKGQTIVHEYPKLNPIPWKGAGLNVHVMSLRSETGWGTGTFTDLIDLAEWASQAGFSMLQLLPVNDTIGVGGPSDSYPYASISAFALHPYLLDVRKMMLQTGANIPVELEEEAARLNALSHIDYEGVFKNRMQILRLIYEADGLAFKDDFAWFDFFDLNREWLVPYAAFSCLRDKYKSPDPANWGNFQKYNEEIISAMVEPSGKDYKDIAFYYFIQFHLHLQFKEAVYRVHKLDMVLKGDLPIGVNRHGVETWMNPELFHMDQQSGAPPDAFSSGGQNWNFPTYNWERMKADGYNWWRQRLEVLSIYFDAVRIDHIIGLFRIWSIPLGHTTGELGTFNPAIGFTKEELMAEGVYFDEDRLCEPYINDAILYFYFHGEKGRIQEQYFDHHKFKPAFATPESLHAWLDAHQDTAAPALRSLMSNVVLIKIGQQYHFRMNMQQTPSFQSLPEDQKQLLNNLYNQYFGAIQSELWRKVGYEKLKMMKEVTTMMLCGEDLGMVPEMVPEIMKEQEVLALYVERMPHNMGDRFADPANAPYLSVVTPSTHDMPPLTLWWQQQRADASYFYHEILKLQGHVPERLNDEIVEMLLQRQLNAPAMWVVFLLQDVIALNDFLQRPDASQDRINDPGNDDFVWDYRVHISIEHLSEQKAITELIQRMIQQSGRA